MTKQTYKFRSECLHDVLEFMKKAKFNYNIDIARSDVSFDVVVEISTVEPLKSIVSIFKSIPDSHVILQTIQPKHLYTGERVVEKTQ